MFSVPQLCAFTLTHTLTNKSFAFQSSPNTTLQYLRVSLAQADIFTPLSVFLLPDATPIPADMQQDVFVRLLSDGDGVVLLGEGEEGDGVPEDIKKQVAINQRQRIYDRFIQHVEVVKARVLQFKAHFQVIEEGLPQINANYKGEVDAQNQYCGLGMYTYNHGQKHIGQFQASQRHGLGVYTFLNGNRYQGQYVWNYANGIGIEYLEHGYSMAAYYRDNSSNGLGVYWGANGEKYYGQFRMNCLSGLVMHYNPDGIMLEEWYQAGDVVAGPGDAAVEADGDDSEGEGQEQEGNAENW